MCFEHHCEGNVLPAKGFEYGEVCKARHTYLLIESQTQTIVQLLPAARIDHSQSADRFDGEYDYGW